MNFYQKITASTIIFQAFLCMASEDCQLIKFQVMWPQKSMNEQPSILAPRSNNSSQFLQALTQFNSETIALKQRQIQQEKNTIQIEMAKRRLIIQEEQATLEEKQKRLDAILMIQKKQYEYIKNQNQDLFNRIMKQNPQKEANEYRRILSIIKEKIFHKDYLVCDEEDYSQNMETLCKSYNIDPVNIEELKRQFYQECQERNCLEQLNITLKGTTIHYSFPDDLQVILVDFSSPKLISKHKKQEKKALLKEKNDLCRNIQNSLNKLSSLYSWMQERQDYLACLVNTEEQLIKSISMQILADITN